MTEQDKQLLLKDLCARLPYWVKVKCAIPTLLICIRNDRNGIKVITEGTYNEHIYNIENIKPYLRPISKMTKEERMKIASMANFGNLTKSIQVIEACTPIIDYCYSRHLDIHCLIEKGLALPAPPDMYKID